MGKYVVSVKCNLKNQIVTVKQHTESDNKILAIFETLYYMLSPSSSIYDKSILDCHVVDINCVDDEDGDDMFDIWEK